MLRASSSSIAFFLFILLFPVLWTLSFVHAALFRHQIGTSRRGKKCLPRYQAGKGKGHNYYFRATAGIKDLGKWVYIKETGIGTELAVFFFFLLLFLFPSCCFSALRILGGRGGGQHCGC